jgi:hypothetical protein
MDFPLTGVIGCMFNVAQKMPLVLGSAVVGLPWVTLGIMTT